MNLRSNPAALSLRSGQFNYSSEIVYQKYGLHPLQNGREGRTGKVGII